jgi:S1-C subfamily serine protease
MTHDPNALPGGTNTGVPREGASPVHAGGWPRTGGRSPYSLSDPSAEWSDAYPDPKLPRGRKAVATIAVMALLVGAVTGAGVLEAENLHSVPASAAVAPPVKVANSPAPSATVSQIVQSVSPSIVAVTATNGSQSEGAGTGMIITSTGQVLTNNHVIDGATLITVALNGSTTQLPATVVGADPDQDVALLQITNQTGLPAVTFADSSQVQVGDSVVAIGNALALGDRASATSGIISALNRQITADDSTGSSTETLTGVLQTDAAINAGNSGGALLNSSGQVIGMNTAAADSTPGTSAQNIGFAIPSNQLESLVSGLRSGGDGSPTSLDPSGSSSSTGSHPSDDYQSPGGYGGLAF